MKRSSIILITLLASLFFSTKSSNAQNVDFSVHPVIPENQIDKNQSYFDLLMEPGDQQELKLIVRNYSDQKNTFTIEPITAVTNKNGNIDYSQTDYPKDSTLKIGFDEIIEGETKYEVEPKSEIEASFKLTMPNEPFEGMMLGGFYITKITNDQEPENGQFRNIISYTIGVKLIESEVKIEPELVLNEITPMLDNYRTAVSANIQNTQAATVGGMTVQTEISKKGSKDILHSEKAENLSMAPNSNFDFSISWDNERLKAGNYHLHMVVADKKSHEWIFDKDFTIKRKAAQDLNSRAVELEAGPDRKLIIIIAVLSLGLLLLTGIIVKQGIKNKGNKSEK